MILGKNLSIFRDRISGASFTPQSLSPILWLEAGTDNYTLDPTNISTWSATVGTDATQSTSAERPAPVTLNGDPFVEFDETNSEHLDMGATYNSMLSGDWTMYFVVEPQTLATNFQFLFGSLYNDGSQKHIYVYFHGDNTFRTQIGISGTARTAQTLTTFSTGTSYIIEVNHDTTANQINVYVNGVQDALDATNDGDTSAIDTSIYNSTNNVFINARNNNGTDDLHGDNSLGDILFFDRLLTSTERTNLGNYYV